MITKHQGGVVTEILDLSKLDQSYFCVVQLKTQQIGVIHQVVLRPDKVMAGLIRLGETQGMDEISGWQNPDNIQVLTILGTAKEEEILNQDDEPTGQTKWTVTPIEEKKLEVA